MLAYGIDSLVVAFLILMPFQKLFPKNQVTYSFLVDHPEVVGNMLILVLIAAALTILYWAILEYRLSQTLGKLIMKIEVRPVKNEITFLKYLLRNISKMSTLLLAVDCIPLFAQKSHQRYLEKVSGTEVVEKGWNI